KVRCRLRTCAKLPSPSIQLAWVYPSLASHRGHASARLQRRRYQPLLLLSRPATATLHRGDDFNRGLAHVTIPMNSHMTHTLTRSTRRPLSEGYASGGAVRILAEHPAELAFNWGPDSTHRGRVDSA